jgi:hypothetical protein
MKHYFQQLASQHINIRHTASERHFFRSIDHFLNDDGNNLANYPAVIMDSMEGQITGDHADDRIDMMRTGILFIQKVTDVDDDDQIDQAHLSMKALAFSFVAKMEADSLACMETDLKMLQEFSALAVSYKYYGPVFDQCFGVLLSFPLGHIAALEYNPEVWLEL